MCSRQGITIGCATAAVASALTHHGMFVRLGGVRCMQSWHGWWLGGGHAVLHILRHVMRCTRRVYVCACAGVWAEAGRGGGARGRPGGVRGRAGDLPAALHVPAGPCSCRRRGGQQRRCRALHFHRWPPGAVNRHASAEACIRDHGGLTITTHACAWARKTKKRSSSLRTFSY